MNAMSKFLGLMLLPFLAGCAGSSEGISTDRWYCDPADVQGNATCPHITARLQEAVMVESFENFFFELTDSERLCVSRYDYTVVTTEAEIERECWPGVWGCTLYRGDGVSSVKVFYRLASGSDAYFKVLQRHEILHLILWCTGEPGSGDHSHPAFVGKLPAFPEGNFL